jgi:uncharacterized protein
MNRRRFLHAAAGTVAAAPLAGACYGLFEASAVRVVRRTVPVPRLPTGFHGTRLAFLTDIHHGPFVSQDFVAAVVRTTSALNPDVVVLGGDYSLRDGKYIGPCFEVLAGLSAPLGVHGVLGNHDYWHGIRESHEGFRSAKINELTNRGVWLEKGGGRLKLTGIDDLWRGHPDVNAAVGDTGTDDACILVSHNPDVAETLGDRRVGLVLSGHTHGGQIVVPGVGSPWVPSRYGQKYAHGLVKAPVTQVYVSAGIGVSGVPVRANRRPEISLLTLTTA